MGRKVSGSKMAPAGRLKGGRSPANPFLKAFPPKCEENLSESVTRSRSRVPSGPERARRRARGDRTHPVARGPGRARRPPRRQREGRTRERELRGRLSAAAAEGGGARRTRGRRAGPRRQAPAGPLARALALGTKFPSTCNCRRIGPGGGGGTPARARRAHQVPDAEQDGAGADMAAQAAAVGVEARPGRDHLHGSRRERAPTSAGASAASLPTPPGPLPARPTSGLRPASPAGAPSGRGCRTLRSAGGGSGRGRGGPRGT